jgi:hypothetical protein
MDIFVELNNIRSKSICVLNELRKKWLTANLNTNLHVCKSTGVYYNNATILITTEHSNIRGVKVLGDPFFKLKIGTIDYNIGECVSTCLSASKSGISQEKANELNKIFWKAAEVRGWDTLEKLWNYISISQQIDSNMVNITGMQKVNTGGYVAFAGECDEYMIQDDDINAIGYSINKIINNPELVRSYKEVQ